MDTYRSKIVGLKQKLIPTRSYLVVKSVLSELPTNHIDTMMILRPWKDKEQNSLSDKMWHNLS
jgi:hypothetical protein